jgi:soluble lytic murein transglycosylase-like protein
MKFCSKLLWLVWFAVSLHAADSGAPPFQLKSVVRSDPKTGKLVRSVVISPKKVTAAVVAPRVPTPAPARAASANPPAAIDRTVQEIAARNSLPPQLLHSVIKVESNYNPFAVSSKGALGMMQLIPATARRFGVANVFDASENIAGGARYLRFLLDLFKGDTRLALAAYNAGEGAVVKYGGVPPFAETQHYLTLVRKQFEARSRAVPVNPPTPALPAPDPVPHIHLVVEPDGSVRYVSRLTL